MLKEINSLGVFFEDCYREISVREYAREMKISPPTASKTLKAFAKEGLLLSREDRGFILFRTNRESKIMELLSLIYWQTKLKELFDFLEEEFFSDAIILFGSLSKLEVREESDIDLAVITKHKKELKLDTFEKKYKRKIQLFVYPSLDKINKGLRLNISKGHLARGFL